MNGQSRPSSAKGGPHASLRNVRCEEATPADKVRRGADAEQTALSAQKAPFAWALG
jgi:hypothetical protein